MGCPGCYYDEIKVGEYIRTINGNIYKVESLTTFVDSDIHIYVKEKFQVYFRLNEIAKHSRKITDLIEIGDVLKIEEDDEIAYIGLERDTTTIAYQDIIDEIKNNKIKLLAIVTKEQFRQIEYKVEE